MSRRALCTGLVLVIGLPLLHGSCGSEETVGNPRSVLLIVIDTLRADHLSLYGYSRPTTPFLDHRAASGVVFERGFATSSWTLPSFGSLYTGQLPAHHRAGRRRLNQRPPFAAIDPSVPVLAEILLRRGFQTAALVTNPFLVPVFGLDRGFETYDAAPASNSQIRRADQVVSDAVEWLDARDERPFFLVVHFFDPHMNYDPTDVVRGRFTSGYHGALEFPFDRLKEVRKGTLTLDASDMAFIGAAYDEEILAVDNALRDLFAALDARQLSNEALVILTSDHGEELFDHNRFEHGHSVYHEVLQVPLIFWGPGIAAARVEEPVSLVDVFPTVFDALELPVPEDLAGVSLWPALRGEGSVPDHDILAEGTSYGPHLWSVIRWPWKIVAVGKKRRGALYNLETDPGESSNLLRSHAAKAEELARIWEDQRASETDPDPTRAPGVDEATLKQLHSLGYYD